MGPTRMRAALAALGVAVVLLGALAGPAYGEATVTVVPAPALSALTPGTDGAMWGLHTSYAPDGVSTSVVRLDASGVLSTTALPAGLVPFDANGVLRALPDGSMALFADRGDADAGRLVLMRLAAGTGALERVDELPREAAGASGLAIGPDGTVWFARSCRDEVDRVGVDGRVVRFRLGRLGCGHAPVRREGGAGLAVDPAGGVWLVNACQGRIARISRSGRVRTWRMPPSACPWRDPDRSLVRIEANPRGGIFFSGVLLDPSGSPTGPTGWVTPRGRYQHFTTAGPGLCASDGTLWHQGRRGFERRAPDGTVAYFPRHTTASAFPGFVETRDGALAFVRASYWTSSYDDPHDPWQQLYLAPQLAVLRSDGGETDVPLPDGGTDAGTYVVGATVALGPDGALWVQEGRLSLRLDRFAAPLVRVLLDGVAPARAPVADVRAVLARSGRTVWIQLSCDADRGRFCVGSVAFEDFAVGLAPVRFALAGRTIGTLPLRLGGDALERLRRGPLTTPVGVHTEGGSFTRRTVRLR
jgi:hypothetical protein